MSLNRGSEAYEALAHEQVSLAQTLVPQAEVALAQI
jgi:hypothetical protein